MGQVRQVSLLALTSRTLSLALGREPTLAPRPNGDPSALPDFGGDDEPWIPYFAHPLNCPPSLQGYIYPRTNRGLAFRLLARLCMVCPALLVRQRLQQIVHDIISGLYGSQSRDSVRHIRAAFVTKTRKRLDWLWQDVPAHLDPNPLVSPPPHVFMFLQVDDIDPHV